MKGKTDSLMNQQKDTKIYTFEDLLNSQGYFMFTNSGFSMMPLLRQHKDVIEIHKKEGRVKKYDVVLYKKGEKYILHRCIAVRPEGYIFAGDHNTYKEYDVTDEMILGVMTRVIRNGKEISLSSFLYKIYSFLWVNLFPVKVLILKIKALFRRLRKISPSRLGNYLNWKMVRLIDLVKDLRITGKDLTAGASDKTSFLERGAGYRPISYLILNKVFSHVQISQSDTFAEIGCGNGRELSFLLSKHCTCSLSGIESDNKLGKEAAEWTKKYKNVHIVLQDIFTLDYNQYTILLLSKSFSLDEFFRFIKLLEEKLTHPVAMICLFDKACGSFLENREGWSMQYCEDFFRISGLQVVESAKRFSVWNYMPAEET